MSIGKCFNIRETLAGAFTREFDGSVVGVEAMARLRVWLTPQMAAERAPHRVTPSPAAHPPMGLRLSAVSLFGALFIMVNGPSCQAQSVYEGMTAPACSASGGHITQWTSSLGQGIARGTCYVPPRVTGGGSSYSGFSGGSPGMAAAQAGFQLLGVLFSLAERSGPSEADRQRAAQERQAAAIDQKNANEYQDYLNTDQLRRTQAQIEKNLELMHAAEQRNDIAAQERLLAAMNQTNARLEQAKTALVTQIAARQATPGSTAGPTHATAPSFAANAANPFAPAQPAPAPAAPAVRPRPEAAAPAGQPNAPAQRPPVQTPRSPAPQAQTRQQTAGASQAPKMTCPRNWSVSPDGTGCGFTGNVAPTLTNHGGYQTLDCPPGTSLWDGPANAPKTCIGAGTDADGGFVTAADLTRLRSGERVNNTTFPGSDLRLQQLRDIQQQLLATLPYDQGAISGVDYEPVQHGGTPRGADPGSANPSAGGSTGGPAMADGLKPQLDQIYQLEMAGLLPQGSFGNALKFSALEDLREVRPGTTLAFCNALMQRAASAATGAQATGAGTSPGDATPQAGAGPTGVTTPPGPVTAQANAPVAGSDTAGAARAGQAAAGKPGQGMMLIDNGCADPETRVWAMKNGYGVALNHVCPR